jgi:hypothetical protein
MLFSLFNQVTSKYHHNAWQHHVGLDQLGTLSKVHLLKDKVTHNSMVINTQHQFMSGTEFIMSY